MSPRELTDGQVTQRATPTHSDIYYYDPQNRMVRRLDDADGAGSAGTEVDFFTHDGMQIVWTFHLGTSGNATLTHRYLWGPGVDQLVTDEQVTSLSSVGTVYWAMTDHLGTVVDVATYNSGTDTTTIAKHRNFDAYGNITYDSAPSVILAIGYTGKWFDSATGLQWNINRWYDPVLGQWFSEDPIGFAGGDENLRRYVHNEVIVGTDPTGLAYPAPGPRRPSIDDGYFAREEQRRREYAERRWGRRTPPPVPPLPSNPASGNFPNTMCDPRITRGGQNDLPDYLPGKWRVSLQVDQPENWITQNGHAWISFERMNSDEQLTGEVHTVGKWPTAGAAWDTRIDLDNTRLGVYRLESVIVDDPVLEESYGFENFNNTCSTYASQLWSRLSGIEYVMWLWDSPNALYNHWKSRVFPPNTYDHVSPTWGPVP